MNLHRLLFTKKNGYKGIYCDNFINIKSTRSSRNFLKCDNLYLF